MIPSDPIRLLEDPQMAASLRADLAHASAASVQGLDHAAGVAGLQAAIATEAAAASGAAGGASTLGKVAIAILLLGGGAAGVWAATGSDDIATPPPEVTAAAVEGGAAEPVEPPRVLESPRPAVVDTPDPEPAIEMVPAAEDEEPAKLSRPRATKVRNKAVPEEADATDRVLREARMIADAREALGRDPSAALALAQGAAREFPNGQLVEEREAIAIRALAKMGRSETAHARAERFLARFGAGPHAEAVRRAIEEPSD